jgi:group I intron endonuclease
MYTTYKITCRGNAKNYYGSTSDIVHRKYVHFKMLNENRHTNKHLQHAFNKYGNGAFYLEILNTFSSREEMIIAEQKLIDEYKKDAFNISSSATGPVLYGKNNAFFGKKHSNESKLKMRNAKLGKNSGMAKKIITDKGIFKSIALACSYHGIRISTYYRRLNKNKTDWITV